MATHKRGNGEGTIYQRKSDGKWTASLTVGVKPDGRPNRRVVYGATRAAVVEKLKELARRFEHGAVGTVEQDRLTVGAFLQRWLDATDGAVRENTIKSYRKIVRLYVPAPFGTMRLQALRSDHLQKRYAEMLTSGLSPNTAHHLHSVLHRALKQAVRWGYLARNVAETVDPPRIPRLELKPPTPEELRCLLDVAEAVGDPWRALWTVAVYSGCRQGEVLGLRWEDVNLEVGKVAIRRTLLGASNSVPRFGEPKTARSQRSVTLDPDAIAVIRDHRARQLAERVEAGPHYANHDLVFCSHLGTPLLARNVLRAFKAALRRAELPETVRFHDLRHAAATMTLSAGVHPKVASERLGHSNVGTTLNLYSHVVPGLEEDAALKVGILLRASPQPASATGQ